MIQVLRRGEQLKVFNDARIPVRGIMRHLFEHRRRALATTISERVRHLRTLAEFRSRPGEDAARPDEIADVGHDPFGARLDELIVVELCHILFEHIDLLGDDREKSLERLALLRIAQAINGGQERVEFLRIKTHSITSRLSGRGSSVTSSAATTCPPPICGIAASISIFSIMAFTLEIGYT